MSVWKRTESDTYPSLRVEAQWRRADHEAGTLNLLADSTTGKNRFLLFICHPLYSITLWQPRWTKALPGQISVWLKALMYSAKPSAVPLWLGSCVAWYRPMLWQSFCNGASGQELLKGPRLSRGALCLLPFSLPVPFLECKCWNWWCASSVTSPAAAEL